MTTFVGIGEWAISDCPGDILKAMALGSCVAVFLFSKRTPCAGLLHVHLPESTVNPPETGKTPGAYADTGIPLLVAKMAERGVGARDLLVKIVGGSNILDPNEVFNIGKRNILAAKKALWACRLWPAAEDVGGSFSRTVSVTVGRTTVDITSPGKEPWTL